MVLKLSYCKRETYFNIAAWSIFLNIWAFDNYASSDPLLYNYVKKCIKDGEEVIKGRKKVSISKIAVVSVSIEVIALYFVDTLSHDEKLVYYNRINNVEDDSKHLLLDFFNKHIF